MRIFRVGANFVIFKIQTFAESPDIQPSYAIAGKSLRLASPEAFAIEAGTACKVVPARIPDETASLFDR
jgi:hypothetical protein